MHAVVRVKPLVPASVALLVPAIMTPHVLAAVTPVVRCAVTSVVRCAVTPVVRYAVTPLKHNGNFWEAVMPLYHPAVTPLYHATVTPLYHAAVTPLKRTSNFWDTVTLLHHGAVTLPWKLRLRCSYGWIYIQLRHSTSASYATTAPRNFWDTFSTSESIQRKNFSVNKPGNHRKEERGRGDVLPGGIFTRNWYAEPPLPPWIN